MPKGAKYKPKDSSDLLQMLFEGIECRDIDFSGLDDLAFLFDEEDDIPYQSNVYFIDPENPDLLIWNTENVTDMSYMFNGKDRFNEPVRLDTRNTTNVQGMFFECTNFNSKIEFTDTSKIEFFSYMFQECNSFNQEIDFDCSSAKEMRSMFSGCKSLNRPIKLRNIGKNNSEEINSKYRFFSFVFDDCVSLKEWNLAFLDFDENLEITRDNFLEVYRGLSGEDFKKFLEEIKKKYQDVLNNEKILHFLNI